MTDAPTMGGSKEHLSRLTVVDAIAERLRQDIKRGSLPPGRRLRQRDVAVRFGVSTTPVREAFQLLQAEGLLRIDTHRGAVVTEASANELLEMYEIRELLECWALECAVQSLTSDDLETLSDLESLMENSTDEHEWVDLNMKFHMKMYEAAARPRLSSMIEKLRAAMSPYLEDLYMSADQRSQAVKEHREILQACKEKDPGKARTALIDHLATTKAILTRLPL